MQFIQYINIEIKNVEMLFAWMIEGNLWNILILEKYESSGFANLSARFYAKHAIPL